LIAAVGRIRKDSVILKQYRFVVECTYTVEDLTAEVVHRNLKGHPDREYVIKDKETWEKANRQRRLLHGLLQDKEALEKFVRIQLACQIQDLALEVIAPHLEIEEETEETILLRVIEQMSTEDVASIASLIENDEFDVVLDFLMECFKLKLDQTTISEITEVHG
jgi:hypothetical protein